MRIEVDDHQHGVAAVRACADALGVADDLVAVGRVEAQVAQPLQRRVLAAELVELGEVRREGAALGLGRGPVARPELELLGVEVLLAAGPHRDVLEQLVARRRRPRSATGSPPARPGS